MADVIDITDGKPLDSSTGTPEKGRKIGATKGPTRQADGLTEKQAHFARLVGQDGMNLTDAYRQAYNTGKSSPATVWNHAYDLSRHARVAPRIAEHVAERERSEKHDPARLKAFVVERLHHEANNAPSDAARVRAVELIGKLDNVRSFVDVAETKIVEDQRSAAELKEDLLERLSRIKLAKP